MYVTVYLVDVNMHTVVPQEFIYQLKQANLNNHGVNTNQNRLIYFSSEFFDALECGNDPTDHIPNFNLMVTKLYPLPNELKETCFIGRLKNFFGKIIEKVVSIQLLESTFVSFTLQFRSMMQCVMLNVCEHECQRFITIHACLSSQFRQLLLLK